MSDPPTPIKLFVQDYLRSGKSLEDLRAEHGIKSFVQNGKISLSYDQIEARESDQLSQQCRGLILRESTFDVVAVPMFRFFNLDQGAAAPVDWRTAQFEEKLDGTLIIAYYDRIDLRWFCATRSRPEADVPVDDSTSTFTDLVNVAIQKQSSFKNLNAWMDYVCQRHLPNPKEYTFCFELCSPVNRIVCEYKDFSLTLLAVRHNTTLVEQPAPLWSMILEVPAIHTYSFNSLPEMLEAVRTWDPKDHEGVVVKDASYQRVKVKNPAYVAFNHMRDSLSTSVRGCVEVILLGKDDDVIAMVPEFIGNRIKRLRPVVAQVLNETERDYNELKAIDDMKSFALATQGRLWPACLFALKRGKTQSVSDFALGLHKESTKVPQSSVDTMIGLCEKLDPSLKDL